MSDSRAMIMRGSEQPHFAANSHFAAVSIIFYRTFDVEAPPGQSPIQLGTLSPDASHELFASAISIEGCSKD